MPALRQREPGFAGLAAIITGQQVSTASAAAIWGRVSAAFDPFHHDALRRARADRLGRLGLSGAKIKTLKNLARELAAERLNLEVLAEEDADAAHNTLTKLHGIGPWTADVYLLFCLGHGDAWPAGDVAIQEAVKVGLGLKTRPTPKQMTPLAEPWRPLRGAAAHLWWAYYKVLKARDGVIAGQQKSNAVLNKAARRKTDIGEGEDRRQQKRDCENELSQLIVARDDLSQSKFIETALPEAKDLPEEAVLVKVERFAFTANNITYATGRRPAQILASVSGAARFRQHSGVGIWRRHRLEASEHRRRRAAVRLFPDGDASRHRGRRCQQARLARCRAASPGRSSRLQRLFTRQRRPCFRRAAGRLPGAAAAAVHAVVSGRRLSRGKSVFRRRQRDPLQRVEQDRLRPCASAAHAAPADPRDRAYVGREYGVRQIARLLRRRRQL